MRKSINNILLKWWLWPLILIVLQIIHYFIITSCYNIGADVTDNVLRVVNFRDPISIISLILIIVNICIWIYYIIKKHKKAIAGHLILMGVAAVICLYNIISVGIWWMFNSDLVDDFGRKHPIPENVEYHEPLSSDYIERGDESGNSDTWLQIKEGGQGGIYYYTFYVPQDIDNGEIWLECYEITENIQLSSKTIKERTLQEITQDNKGKFTGPKEFSIYEGVWGEFYLARIEVWFQDSSTHTKQKISEKIYKVEGWMR